jgi:hypothetical protein
MSILVLYLNHYNNFYSFLFYTVEDLKRHVLNLQLCGIGDDFKQSTPAVCRFKCSPV